MNKSNNMLDIKRIKEKMHRKKEFADNSFAYTKDLPISYPNELSSKHFINTSTLQPEKKTTDHN